MAYPKGHKVTAFCPQWGKRLPGTILHYFQGLHFGICYRIQPDDEDLPIGDATPDQISTQASPIEEPQPMTSQTYRVGDYVELFADWLPPIDKPKTVLLKEIDPDNAPLTHAVLIGDRYSWVNPSELGRVIVPASGRVVVQSMAVSAPELFPVGGKAQ